MAIKTMTDSGRIFKNPWLEALTRTHIAIPLCIFFGTGGLALCWSVIGLDLGALESISFFFIGLVFFTLVEYTVHRYCYHMGTGSPRRARLQYALHGVHHEHPRDKRRLSLPPVASIIVAAVFLGLFRLVLGLHGYAFGGGFLTAYALYLLIHYSIHALSPPKNFLRVLWKHHHLHHFVGDTAAFGVSSPLWDHVFGTMPTDPRLKKEA
ncbi:MAG TPA: sterol desaturase family protein [Flavobacteriales bacterium]|nr:sterol desaturase family protein [Flavobacteriales bacterium]